MYWGMRMSVAYSLLNEIHRNNFIPSANEYGLRKVEFQKVAHLTNKGITLLEDNIQYQESYPERKYLIKWVQVEKELYSNGSEHQ